ncbi:MAG TPA: hypothetical protein VM013_02865 [Dehalococcoidia bacterium]|nr:hypothetical protein [Dehalococcoidia bacterium]
MQHPPFDELPPERLEISQSALRSLSGGQVIVTQSAVQHLLAAQANIRQSSVGSAKGERLSLRQSVAAAVIGREVSAEGARVLLLVTPSLRGSVRPVLTLQSAFALGAGFFFGRWLVRSVGRLLKG